MSRVGTQTTYPFTGLRTLDGYEGFEVEIVTTIEAVGLEVTETLSGPVGEVVPGGRGGAVDEQLAARARAEGVDLSGENGHC